MIKILDTTLISYLVANYWSPDNMSMSSPCSSSHPFLPGPFNAQCEQNVKSRPTGLLPPLSYNSSSTQELVFTFLALVVLVLGKVERSSPSQVLMVVDSWDVSRELISQKLNCTSVLGKGFGLDQACAPS